MEKIKGFSLKKKINLIILFFSFLGILIAIYLTYEHFSIQKEIGFCPIFENGCNAVLSSEYSMFLDVIPVAILGIFYYLFVFFANYLYFKKEKKIFFKISFFLSFTGAVFSIYLFYVQHSLIENYCFYCISSAIISIIIFFLDIYLFRKKEDIS